MHSESPFYYPLQEDDERHDQPLNAHLKAALCGVKSAARCPDCGQPNVVVTLGVAPDRFDLPCPEFKFFTLFGITELPSTVLAMLKRINPHMRPLLRRTAAEAWISQQLCGLRARL